MPTPIETLRDEHRVILTALELLELAVDRLEGGRLPPAGWWERLVGWLRSFADLNHHAKEERLLFPAMAAAGVPAEAGGPIAVMLDEHADGRALLSAMETGDPAVRAAAARRYLRLLRDHIDKENGVLFPQADAVLDGAAAERLQRDFDAIAAEGGGDGSIAPAEATLGALAGAIRTDRVA